MSEDHPETGRRGHDVFDGTTAGETGPEKTVREKTAPETTGPEKTDAEKTVLLRPAGRPREFKTAHLVVGLIYLGIAAAWALHASGVVENGAGYLVPGVLVLAGLVGLIAGFVASRRRTHTQEEILR